MPDYHGAKTIQSLGGVKIGEGTKIWHFSHILIGSRIETSRKEKQPIAIENLNDALQYAEQDLKDRWGWYKDRYKRRLKE